MSVYAFVARSALASRVGGDEGRVASALAQEWIAKEGVKRPELMIRVLAQGA